MKVLYDPDKDVLQIAFIEEAVEETAQIAPGLILDYNEDGNVIGLELRKASERTNDPYLICYQVGEADMSKPQPVKEP